MVVAYSVFLIALIFAGAAHGNLIQDENDDIGDIDSWEDLLKKFLEWLFSGGNTEDKPKYAKWKWDSSSCVVLKKNHGEDNECDWKNGYVAVGQCQSGSSKNCDGYSTKIYCCKTGWYKDTQFSLGATCDSSWKAANAGGRLNCWDDKVIGGICGSGAQKDCKRGGDSYHNKVRCCTGSKYTVYRNPKQIAYPWKNFLDHESCDLLGTRDWGKDLICPDNKLMASACGSGTYRDCGRMPYTHQIQCCPFKYTEPTE